ncbi:mitochondrial F1-FO ATP synthase peripheral stalk assembly factor Ina17 [Schizosaccharomyces osmophilus]|uniref:Mitochondrial F1-FO ATP synthase peripheral stalk assembly factor Ina17 n=1 Tax=Schizosaccharomyces osmophilus TaxID=2545709 RepID=A0AAE9W6Q9_9SCHI|nr:mitochondrial F1-FO ATP synthase peripheral stalk assembly factor Ina17 [Schizosaccharomyces osmophilus]WBW70569.1 mitochondrial F1-FO ATP synthase peripheral stalk assembly factor Ina17 [Schizosaccharomyces osmophilus]
MVFFKGGYQKPLLIQRRLYSQTQQPSPHIMFYKNYARPLGKVMLFALATYYGLDLFWWKMNSNEEEAEKKAELEALAASLK